MQVILYTLPDGKVCRIRHFCRQDGSYSTGIQRRLDEGMPLADVIADAAERNMPDGATWRLIDMADLPPGPVPDSYDKTFYAALRCQGRGKRVTVDMVEARNIWRDKLRQARAPLMARLDIEQKRALVAEDRAEVSKIEARLQALRDATADPSIDAAKTPDDLKACWPEALCHKP